MKPKFSRKSVADGGAPAESAETLAAHEQIAPASAEYRACCCPARPIVRAVMPPSAACPSPVDLLLCGHHYRMSQAALAAAGATVEELPGRSADVAAALFSQPETTVVPAG